MAHGTVGDVQRRMAQAERELSEALERQAATDEVLRVISASRTDVQPVFDMIVRSAVALCGSLFANVFRFDGKLLHFVASHNVGPNYVELLHAKYPMGPDFSQVSGRVLLTKSVVRLEDVLADRDYDARFPQAMGWRRMLGVPMLRDGNPLGVIVVGWAEAGPVSKVQEELLKTFADQAVVAIENVRLFEAEQQRTRDLTESLEQQTATSEVLSVISSSPGELEPVFQAMLENATRICGANFGNLYLRDGDAFRIAAALNTPPSLVEARRRMPLRADSNMPSGRVARTKQVVHVADMTAEEAYISRDPEAVAAVELGGIRTLLVVPMLKEQELIGTINIFRQEVRPFNDKQIELVKNFANQAVIAIENTRLLNELRQRTGDLSEALAQQTATSEVLQVISSSPGDLTPVFNSILANARRICEAKFAHLLLYDGAVFHAAAFEGASPAVVEFWQRGPHALDPETGPRRAVATKQIVHVPDLQQTKRYRKPNPQLAALADLAGARSVLVVPMLKDDRVIGTLSIYRGVPVRFTDKQIELVSSFAAQAVIAIENTRLLKELRESLAQQTATADVLKVISRSTFDLQAVLDTLVESAARLCEADMASVNRQHGDAYRQVANYGHSPALKAYMDTHSIPAGRGSVVGRTILEGNIVQILDVLADPEFTFIESAKVGGVRTMLGVPLLRHGTPIGVIVLQRTTVRRFTEKQIELVTTFADQAVIAIENVRLFDEVQARTRELSESLEQQTATSEVLKVISSSPGELEPVFGAMLENATRICEAKFGNFLLYNGSEFRVAAMHGAPPEWEELRRREPIVRGGPRNPLGRLARTKQSQHVADIRTDEAYVEGDPSFVPMADVAGARTLLVVPMLKDDELIGAMSIYRQEVRPFSGKQIELITNFAAQAVIAIENTRLLNELRESLEQQTATSEVLSVISSSPGELGPVFDNIVVNATRICGAQFGNLHLCRDGGFLTVAQYGAPPAYAELRRREPMTALNRGSSLDRLARTKQVIHIEDIAADPAHHQHPIVTLGGARTLLGVPMLKDDELIGAIGIYRQEVRSFSDKQIELVKNFASQAVVAIENTRLLNELRQRTNDLTEALAQQTATSEVLQVISSSPGELEPVFQAMLANATRICQAAFGSMLLGDGNPFRRVALHNAPLKFAEFSERAPLMRSADAPSLHRLVRTRQAVHVADLAVEGPDEPIAKFGGARTLLIVPMLRENELIGAIGIYRQEMRQFTDKQVALVQNFANQAVIAIENTRLLNELRKSLQQQTATADVLKVISRSTFDLQTVLTTLIEFGCPLV